MNSLTRMERIINTSYINIAGIVVVKNGEKKYEQYYDGYTSENKVHVASVTKSIVSAIFGIAFDRGYIHSPEQKVLEFFPDYKILKGEQAIQKITLENLLTMTAPYKYKTEPYEKYFTSDNWVQFGLDSLGGRNRIGDFLYTPIIGAHILSGIFYNATGYEMLDFARKNLFEPIGIEVRDNIVLNGKEEHVAFSKNRNVNGWVADPQGHNTASWGLTLTTEDMAKIGQLYLNGGAWDSRQIISSSWVEESTRVHSHFDKFRLAYGYLWWIIDEEAHIYAAMGQGGNIIYINQGKKLVVTLTVPFVLKAKDSIKLIRDYVEPVFI